MMHLLHDISHNMRLKASPTFINFVTISHSEQTDYLNVYCKFSAVQENVKVW